MAQSQPLVYDLTVTVDETGVHCADSFDETWDYPSSEFAAEDEPQQHETYPYCNWQLYQMILVRLDNEGLLSTPGTYTRRITQTEGSDAMFVITTP